jgi:hypothetical protein
MDVILTKYYALTPKQKKNVAEKFLEVLNENEETRKKSGKKSTAKFKKVTKLETERDTALFNRLRAWRNQTAESAGLDIKSEAWQIMKNDPLMNAAFYKPANEEEFLRVDGMTEQIFESYGQSILAIITGKTGEVSLPKAKGKVVTKAKAIKKTPAEDVEDDLADEADLDPEDAIYTAPSKLNWFLPSNK